MLGAAYIAEVDRLFETKRQKQAVRADWSAEKARLIEIGALADKAFNQVFVDRKTWIHDLAKVRKSLLRHRKWSKDDPGDVTAGEVDPLSLPRLASWKV